MPDYTFGGHWQLLTMEAEERPPMTADLGGAINDLRNQRNDLENRLKLINDALAALERLQAGRSEFGYRGPSYENMSIADAAMHLLVDLGTPLATSEIAGRLIERGKRTTGKNWGATVFQTLKVSKRFLKDADGNWTPKTNEAERFRAALTPALPHET